MYSTSLRPWGKSIASATDALAEIHLSMLNYWGEIQRDIIRRYTASIADGSAHNGDDTDADAPDAVDAEGGPEADKPSVEVSATDEPAALNAAQSILNNPALAAEAATRQANDAADFEVRDDVADDIAAEIQREVRQEFNPPAN
jgi:hypothetical protein